MALYLGTEKRNIIINNAKVNLQFYTSVLITNGALLKSSDDFILKDSNGLYITVKEDE